MIAALSQSRIYCFVVVASILDYCFFFFTDTATTEIYTLSLHDALPISAGWGNTSLSSCPDRIRSSVPAFGYRSEEHTSELQSHSDLVCRLLLEKKKKMLTEN